MLVILKRVKIVVVVPLLHLIVLSLVTIVPLSFVGSLAHHFLFLHLVKVVLGLQLSNFLFKFLNLYLATIPRGLSFERIWAFSYDVSVIPSNVRMLRNLVAYDMLLSCRPFQLSQVSSLGIYHLQVFLYLVRLIR